MVVFAKRWTNRFFRKSDIIDRIGGKKEKIGRWTNLKDKERCREETNSFDFASLRQTPGFPECFFDLASHSCPRRG